MALEEDMEFQKLKTLIRQFGWDITEQRIGAKDLVVVATKPRPEAPAGAAAPGGPVSLGAT